MFLRWDRSYIREEILLWKIRWKLPLPALMVTLVEPTITNLRYPVAYSSLGLMISVSVQNPLTVVRLLMPIGLVSIFYSLYFSHSERSRGFFYEAGYAYFHFVSLLWIFLYARVTVRDRSLMTR